MVIRPETHPDSSMMSSYSPDDAVIRILLMGRNENSSTKTILGEGEFTVQTQKRKHEVCECQTQIRGKQVAVIDCPDLLDPDLNEEKLEMMKEQLISQCSAGLTAVLLTVPLEKPLTNEEKILDYITCLFGPEVQKYIMILFTHGDELEELDQTIHEYLQDKDHEDLQLLVTECGGKFHCFNNKKNVKGQVEKLLQKTEGIMEENHGNFFMEKMQRNDSMDILNLSFSGKSLPKDPASG